MMIRFKVRHINKSVLIYVLILFQWTIVCWVFRDAYIRKSVYVMTIGTQKTKDVVYTEVI